MSYSSLPERNPMTQQIHQREVLRQITLPLLIGVLVMLALCLLAAAASSPSASRWADISLIWIILPSLFFALIVLVLTGAIAYGVILLVRKLPGWMLRLQTIFGSIGEAVRRLDDKLVEPFMKVQSFDASVNAFFASFRKK